MGSPLAQAGLASNGKEAIAGPFPAVADASENGIPRRRILDEIGISGGNAHVGFGEHHLQIGQRALEEGPARDHLAKQLLIAEVGERLSRSVPAGEHHSGLGPAKYPWEDRKSQRLN